MMHPLLQSFFISIEIDPADVQAFQINWDRYKDKPMQVAVRMLNDQREVNIEIVKELTE